jgi:hypothetical protein
MLLVTISEVSEKYDNFAETFNRKIVEVQITSEVIERNMKNVK